PVIPPVVKLLVDGRRHSLPSGLAGPGRQVLTASDSDTPNIVDAQVLLGRRCPKGPGGWGGSITQTGGVIQPKRKTSAGLPPTFAAVEKRAPASSSDNPSAAVVTNMRGRSRPTRQTLDGWRVGTRIVSAKLPSGRYRLTSAIPQIAT